MKGNLMIRVMTLLILVAIVLSHLSGQTNLLSLNWLWLAILPAFMGLQATFTGWCPAELIGKLSKTGECCPGGSCSTPSPTSTQTAAQSNHKMNEQIDEPVANQTAPVSSRCCESQPDTLEIKVLGTGCANCESTAKLIRTTADEHNIAITLTKIEDISEIAAYGVMSTPGVVIFQTVVHTGGIPSKSQIIEWFNHPPKNETAQ